MKLQVFATQTERGWFLETADDSKDELAGPFGSEDELLAEADLLDVEILSTQVLTASRPLLIIKDRKPKDLFRVGDDWYRLIVHESRGKSKVEVVGERREIQVPSNTEISEISVLTLR